MYFKDREGEKISIRASRLIRVIAAVGALAPLAVNAIGTVPAYAAVRAHALAASSDLELRAFSDPLVQEIIASERSKPRDTVLCGRPEIVALYAAGLLFEPYPCNGWTVLTSYAAPTYGGGPAIASYVEFIASAGVPASAAVDQGLYTVAFPAAPSNATPEVYLESIGVSPYPSITFAGSPPAKYAADNLVVSTSITKGATYEIFGYRWDPVGLQYVSTYSSGPFHSKYGKLAYFPGFLQNGQAIPQLSRLYFVLYACANTTCT